MSKLLIVEDNPEIADMIELYFHSRGYEVMSLGDGSKIEETVSGNKIDIILLDIMLPGIDGFEICRKLRRFSDVPIVFLTAKTSENDLLYGYSLGADDYVTKPFSLPALYAKVGAILSRSGEKTKHEILSCGMISIDDRSFIVYSGDCEINLPLKEFMILKYLVLHKDWVVDRQTILDKVWGIDYYGSDRVVDNHIKNLRKLLGKSGKQIKTVFSRGYKISDE